MQITALNVSTRQLRGLLALAQLRSFTRAAEQMHLSQPAFSALIRALEEAVGTRLFERDTRKVSLTAEGALFVDSAARLLRDFEHSLADLGEHVARRRGRVARHRRRAGRWRQKCVSGRDDGGSFSKGRQGAIGFRHNR